MGLEKAKQQLAEIVAKEVAPELEKLKEAAIEQIRKIVEGLEAIIAQNKNSYGILDHITDAVKKFEEKAKEVISGLVDTAKDRLKEKILDQIHKNNEKVIEMIREQLEKSTDLAGDLIDKAIEKAREILSN